MSKQKISFLWIYFFYFVGLERGEAKEYYLGLKVESRVKFEFFGAIFINLFLIPTVTKPTKKNFFIFLKWLTSSGYFLFLYSAGEFHPSLFFCCLPDFGQFLKGSLYIQSIGPVVSAVYMPKYSFQFFDLVFSYIIPYLEDRKTAHSSLWLDELQ